MFSKIYRRDCRRVPHDPSTPDSLLAPPLTQPDLCVTTTSLYQPPLPPLFGHVLDSDAIDAQCITYQDLAFLGFTPLDVDLPPTDQAIRPGLVKPIRPLPLPSAFFTHPLEFMKWVDTHEMAQHIGGEWFFPMRNWNALCADPNMRSLRGELLSIALRSDPLNPCFGKSDPCMLLHLESSAAQGPLRLDALANCTNLASLTIEHWSKELRPYDDEFHLNPAIPKNLAFPALEQLSLDAGAVCTNIINMFGETPYLNHLTLGLCAGSLTASRFLDIPDQDLKRFLDRFLCIDVIIPEKVSEDALIAALEKIFKLKPKKLRGLSLTVATGECTTFDARAIIPLLPPRLMSLNLEGWWVDMYALVTLLSKHTPGLQSLVLNKINFEAAVSRYAEPSTFIHRAELAALPHLMQLRVYLDECDGECATFWQGMQGVFRSMALDARVTRKVTLVGAIVVHSVTPEQLSLLPKASTDLELLDHDPAFEDEIIEHLAAKFAGFKRVAIYSTEFWEDLDAIKRVGRRRVFSSSANTALINA